MKRTGLSFAAALLIAAASVFVSKPHEVKAGPHYPDVCNKSILCAGLSSYFEFDEPLDNSRFSSGGSLLHEPQGFDVSTTTTAGNFKTGTGALDFVGVQTNKFLWSLGSFPGDYLTISIWAKPSAVPANGTKYSLVSWDNATVRGTDIYLESNGSNYRACIKSVNAETDAATTACSGYTLAGSTYYLLAFGSSAFHEGQNRIWTSVNAGAKTTAAQGYYLRSGRSYCRIRQRPWGGPTATGDQSFDGYLDQLATWGRELSPEELTLLYNSGNARAFPFDTDELD